MKFSLHAFVFIALISAAAGAVVMAQRQPAVAAAPPAAPTCEVVACKTDALMDYSPKGHGFGVTGTMTCRCKRAK